MGLSMEDVLQSRCFKAGSRGNILKKNQKLFHATVLFNNIPVQRSTVQKHLGVYLDEKLNFNTHITEEIGKASKGIGVIKKLFKILPRSLPRLW